MILNDFLGDSDRIEILESFLDNEGYSLTLDDVRRISVVSNPLNDLTILVNIGILSEQNGEYKLNLKDKRVIFLSLIDLVSTINQDVINTNKLQAIIQIDSRLCVNIPLKVIESFNPPP